MAKNPQCPRCGDTLSALTIVPKEPAYPQGVCVVCVKEIEKALTVCGTDNYLAKNEIKGDAEAKANADKLMGRAAEIAGTMTRADALAGIAEVCGAVQPGIFVKVGGAEGPLPAGGLDTGPDVATAAFTKLSDVRIDKWDAKAPGGPAWQPLAKPWPAPVVDATAHVLSSAEHVAPNWCRVTVPPLGEFRACIMPERTDDVQEQAQAAATRAIPLRDLQEFQERTRLLSAPTTTASPRDYFAAHVLPAFIKIVQSTGRGLTAAECYAKAAQHAYQQADAMLTARAVQPEQNTLPPNEREELHKLRVFKTYVHSRLDAAGVEKDPESEHKAEGCRIGGRLDIVLRKFAEVEKWHLLSMLSRAGIGHGIRPDYDGGRPVGVAVLVENFGDGEDEYISEFQFDNAGALKAVHCYPHEGG